MDPRNQQGVTGVGVDAGSRVPVGAYDAVRVRSRASPLSVLDGLAALMRLNSLYRQQRSLGTGG